MKPDEITLAYLAGFFDGEGYVGISKGYKTSYYLLVCTVTQTDVTPLMIYHQWYKGKVQGPRNVGGNRKPIYWWKAEANRAEKFLLDIQPYLVVKAERVKLALEFRELFKGDNILPRGLTINTAKKQKILELRQDKYEQMAQLNKRGIA